jgi:hypothetical protein
MPLFFAANENEIGFDPPICGLSNGTVAQAVSGHHSLCEIDGIAACPHYEPLLVLLAGEVLEVGSVIVRIVAILVGGLVPRWTVA